MPVNDQLFERLAEKTLQNLLETIDDALGDLMDVDMDGGILTIELESGGQYVINKQSPNREIWMSSPLSGAKHFYFDDEKKSWVDTRNGDDFLEILSAELANAAGKPFSLV